MGDFSYWQGFLKSSQGYSGLLQGGKDFISYLLPIAEAVLAT
jgi:hypothetical protein